MKLRRVLWSLCLAALSSFACAQQATVIVVAGAPGEADFAPDIQQQIDAWAKVSAQARAKHISIGAEAAAGTQTDRDRLQQALAA